MRLELASFTLDQIAIEDAAARLALDDPRLASVEVAVVRPGEPVRVTHVLDAVEPRVKADDPDSTFPGALGSLRSAGEGRTHRIASAAVLACGRLDTDDQLDGIVDMAGPGAQICEFSRTTNVVLSFERAPGVENEEFDAAMREARLRAARDLAAETLGREPAEVEALEYRLGGSRVDGLPAVALLLQLTALGPIENIYLYGATLDGFQPSLLNPLEVLDGALVCGEYYWAALRNPTYCFQNSALVRELLEADGERLRFAGLVACRAYNQSARDKELASMLAARLARELGAQGAIVTTDGGGNSHTDTMLAIRHCERAGVRAVAVVAEMGGLTDHVPEADAIVSTGNAEELVPEWRPRLVLGGDLLLDGRPAAEAGPLPVRSYLGATTQTGQMPLRAVTS